MGQRHQIYVRLPKVFYNKGNPNNRPATVIGLHHQWLYGQRALAQLEQFLSFVEKQDEYGPFTDKGDIGSAIKALSSLYSININDGYYHTVWPLMEEDNSGYKREIPGQECKNPMCGDNNNGITVIDLSGKEPKYCFMSLHHLECLDDAVTDNDYKNLEPMSAEQYLRLHYPGNETNCSCDYCQRNPEKKAKHNAETRAFHLRNQDLIERLTNFKVLRLVEVKRIFPKMYQEDQEEVA